MSSSGTRPARRPGASFVEDRWHVSQGGRKARSGRYGHGKRWRARWTDPQGQERSKSFDRKVDAEQHLSEIAADLHTGRYVDQRAGDITFSAFMDGWAALQVWKPRTVAGNDLIRRSVPFGDVPLRHLSRSHLETWKKSMVGRYAPQTIKQRLMVVKAVLNAAVADNRIPASPAAEVKPVRIDGRSKRVTVPDAAEVAAVLEASDSRMRLFIELAAFGGLRFGECSAVQAGDVDFLRRVLHVQRQVQARPGGRPEVREPKYESVRDVPIPEEVVLSASRHIEENGITSGGWLFPTGGGDPIPPSTAHYWWKRTTVAAGVPGLQFHSLRHFYASGLIAAGCDVVTVQRALGHSKPSTTLDTYSHLWPNAEDRTRQAASSLVRGVMDGSFAQSLNASKA